jgi:HAMP domain-containing protein
LKLGFFGTLRTRIFAALFAISLVPIAVLGIQGYHCSMQAVSELAQNHLAAMADARAAAVTNWLQERTRSVVTLASLPTTLTGDTLDSFRAANADFQFVAIYDTQWNLIARTKGASGDETFVDTVFRSNMEKTGASFLNALSSQAGETDLALGCPVRGANGQSSGFLVARLDFAGSLTPTLQDRKGLYNSGKVFLVSHDGQVLTQPLPGEQMAVWKRGGGSSAGHHMADSLTTGVTTYEDDKGHIVLGTIIPVSVDGWHLVAEIDRDEAMGWLRILLIRAAVTGLVTCVLVVGIAAWISRLVGKPLRELMRVASRIRAGHTEERLSQMDVVEAEEVRQAFNAMLDELHEKQDELVKTATLAYVGELTSSTVHEMRNPLSSIKMNLQALSRGGRPERPVQGTWRHSLGPNKAPRADADRPPELREAR